MSQRHHAPHELRKQQAAPAEWSAAPDTQRDQALSVHVREEPTRTWVALVGALGLPTVDVFDQCMWAAPNSARRIDFDLRKLTFIDSVGLRALFAARLSAVEWHHRLEVICGPGQVRRMLSVSGFDRLIEVIEESTSLQVLDARQAAA